MKSPVNALFVCSSLAWKKSRNGNVHLMLLPLVVRQRTISCSSPEPALFPWPFTMRSDKISNLTSPMIGRRFHARGDVHRAAMYATRPDTVGRCGCVEGNRWSEMLGARISWGKGDWSNVGRRSWRMRRAGKKIKCVSSCRPLASSHECMYECRRIVITNFFLVLPCAHLAACQDPGPRAVCCSRTEKSG